MKRKLDRLGDESRRSHLPAGLTITPQQLLALSNPAVSLKVLADRTSLASQIAGRPIRLWAKDPNIARQINDALQPDAG